MHNHLQNEVLFSTSEQSTTEIVAAILCPCEYALQLAFMYSSTETPHKSSVGNDRYQASANDHIVHVTCDSPADKQRNRLSSRKRLGVFTPN